ncbi:diguanylate cyclase [Brucellaceae bacterium C25G]
MTASECRIKLPTTFLLLMTMLLFSAILTGKADSTEIRSSCWAQASLTEDILFVSGQQDRWSCDDNDYSIDAERVLLRFDTTDHDASLRYLLSRRSAIKAIQLLAFDNDGTVRQNTIAASDLESSLIGGYFAAPLPEITQQTKNVIVAFDMPTNPMIIEKAYLGSSDINDAASNIRLLIILAGLAGMLVMPLIFNAAFYRILREAFVLWHSALTLSLLSTIILTSGLSVVFYDLPSMTLSWMTTVVFGAMVAAGVMFTYSFIEPGMMNPRLRRLLPYCALWSMALSILHAAFPFVARSMQTSMYTAAFTPVLIVFMLAMYDALRRGSHAAKFQAIGYTPIILVGSTRMITGIIPGFHSNDAMILFYIGCLWEVLFTTLGVAERFVTMKRERDRARYEADILEKLSETDPLTGLLNRRAIERQFKQLKAEGFSSLAVIDIDHFKTINDHGGHSTGDEVLKCVAYALHAGPDVRAYRLGGEEFVLLLRGTDTERQAELRRQAIPSIVAQTITGLTWPVTASMGFTNITNDESFQILYERADKLLYKAKSDGRNRSVKENTSVQTV